MFSYQMQTRIEFGVHTSTQLTTYLEQEQIPERILLVSDKGIVRAGLVEPIQTSLQKAGYTALVFDQVAQNPRDVDCLNGVEVFQGMQAEAVLAIGGGSAMDTAKAIALISQSGGTPQEYADGDRTYHAVAPIICIPTTAGTGSEVTRSSVITEASTHRKMTLKHALLRPRLAVLDPVLTVSVPRSVTAATGVDALVHAIEGYTCTVTTPIARAFGARAMQLIVPSLPLAVADGQYLDARTDMLLGSLLAGLCFGSTDVAAVHCLAEALGGLYDTPHGVANAVFLPYVLKFNAQANVGLHAELARLMRFAADHDSEEQAVQKLVEGISNFTSNLAIPRLRDLPNVNPDDFDRIAELALANGSTPSNVRPIDLHQYKEILEEAYRG